MCQPLSDGQSTPLSPVPEGSTGCAGPLFGVQGHIPTAAAGLGSGTGGESRDFQTRGGDKSAPCTHLLGGAKQILGWVPPEGGGLLQLDTNLLGRGELHVKLMKFKIGGPHIYSLLPGRGSRNVFTWPHIFIKTAEADTLTTSFKVSVSCHSNFLLFTILLLVHVLL